MDTLTMMQKAISELHRVFISVKDYLEKKKPMEKAKSLDIDYTNPDQEFYLRNFMEFGQLMSTVQIGLDYIDRPVRKQGQLVFDFSEGKYELDGEYIEEGTLFEAMVDGLWYIVRMKKKAAMEYCILNVVKQTEYDVELKGLTVRMR